MVIVITLIKYNHDDSIDGSDCDYNDSVDNCSINDADANDYIDDVDGDDYIDNDSSDDDYNDSPRRIILNL